MTAYSCIVSDTQFLILAINIFGKHNFLENTVVGQRLRGQGVRIENADTHFL